MDNGVGPLRIWPGGLCLSRAIGDFDVGDAVIPFPHVMQVGGLLLGGGVGSLSSGWDGGGRGRGDAVAPLPHAVQVG